MDSLKYQLSQKEPLLKGTESRSRNFESDKVFQRLRKMIAEIIGEDVAEIVGVTERSTFLRDLGMNSIQIVALAEMIRSEYGDRVDVMGWFAKRSIFTMVMMNVSDVVKLIVKGE